MHRFFVDRIIEQKFVQLKGPDAKHAVRVLRLKPGDFFVAVLDGCGQFEAKVLSTGLTIVYAEITKRVQTQTEARTRVTLFQGIPKGDKMNDVVQRCSEIGVHRIIPVLTERTVAVPSPQRLQARMTRWQKIASEAAELAGRTRSPKVAEPIDFRTVLACAKDYDLRLMPWEEEHSRSIGEVLKNTRADAREVLLLIGPEGGFCSKEAEAAAKHGILPVTMGPRTMRTQNAGAVALAIILYELGDMD